MNESEIRLGKCYLARLSKVEMPIRLERNHPDGGWVARSLTHGRQVRIKAVSQLLDVYDKESVREIASETSPHRRSQITGIVRLPTPKTTEENGHRPIVTVIRPKPEPVVKKIVLVRLNLLDAAHKVLSETKKAMTTREIVAACNENGYWTSSAATPWATLNAALNHDIAANGTLSRFVKKERGLYSLR